MSGSKTILYPPEEILNPPLGKNRNFEFIILWMLKNNEYCTWSDFKNEISESTLSGYLNKLKDQEFVDYQYNRYQITSMGKERYLDLLSNYEEPQSQINYPPDIIKRKNNYEDIILWMTQNNESLKWSDFRNDPVKINSTALSKSLSALKLKEFIRNEDGQYKITSIGKSGYFRMLRKYDLDRQSILEEESKRIEDFTERMHKFFKKYRIEDDDLKFRFLNNALKLNYEKVENFIDKEDFTKILLFISYNHPNQYPDFISIEEFSFKYKIRESTLKFIMDKIVDESFFSVKFFILEDDEERVYYFQKNEAIEKILNAIVEKYIIKFTYLNKFQKKPTINIELLLDNILNDICGNIFNKNLNLSLRNFLPEYIKYLAYKIETEKKLIDRETKLEGFIWQNIFDEFQTFEPSNKPKVVGAEDKYFYNLDNRIFNALDIVYLNKLNFLMTDEVKETYNFSNIESFNKIVRSLYKFKLTKAKELYNTITEDIDEFSNLVLKDVLNTSQYNFEESVDITSEIIEKFPNEYLGYLLQSITYFLMDEYKKALEIIEKGLMETPHPLLMCQKAQIFIKINEEEKAVKIIDESLKTHPNCTALLRTKFLAYILYWFYLKKDPKEVLEIINTAMKLSPNDKELVILKGLFNCVINKYKEAKLCLIKDLNFNYFRKNPQIDTTALFILTFTYMARGKFDKAMNFANQLISLYSDYPIAYLTKALVLGYNLIFKFKLQESNIDNFTELIEKAISLDLIKSNKARYLQLKAYILHGIEQYEEALETINRAIEIVPELYILYNIKILLLMVSKREFDAIDLIDDLIEKYPNLKKKLYMQKSFIYFNLKRYDDALEIVYDLIESYPEDIILMNNKAIFLGYLGRKEEAIEAAEHLISMNPNNGNSYDTYGEILMALGEYNKAIKKLEEALKIEPLGWFACQTSLKLGKCYQELGLYEKALNYYEKGKILTERMLPSERELYEHETEKHLIEIRSLIEKSKINDQVK